MSDLRGLSGHQGGSREEGEPSEHTNTWTPLAVSESVNCRWPQPKPAQTANFYIGFQEFVSHKSAQNVKVSTLLAGWMFRSGLEEV